MSDVIRYGWALAAESCRGRARVEKSKNTRGPRGEKSIESVGHSRSAGECLLSVNGY